MMLQVLGGVNLPCGWYCIRGQLPSTGGQDHTPTHTHTYNYVHNAALLQIILKELGGAGGVRGLKDAPAPGAGTTHLVAKSASYPQAMMDGDTGSVYTKLAYGVISDSDLSKEDCKPHGHDCK